MKISVEEMEQNNNISTPPGSPMSSGLPRLNCPKMLPTTPIKAVEVCCQLSSLSAFKFKVKFAQKIDADSACKRPMLPLVVLSLHSPCPKHVCLVHPFDMFQILASPGTIAALGKQWAATMTTTQIRNDRSGNWGVAHSESVLHGIRQYSTA